MTTSTPRREQVAAFFGVHADRLHRTVAYHVRGDDQVVDDACATAWTILMRRPDITLDARGFSWLATVATRAAWQLHANHRHEIPIGGFQADPRDHDHPQDVPEPVDPLAPDTETRALDHIQHAADLQALKTFKPLGREALYLKGLGYSYHEIRLTGSTYTAVNRRITEGRRALRRCSDMPDEQTLESARGEGENTPADP
jgi:DNA-directed RNA polymerase specialized sigma24 family protein